MEEEEDRYTTRRPPPSRRRSGGWRRGEAETIVVDESATSRSGSDAIEVEEESNSGYGREPPRRGGYRTVDPLAYGGGSDY